MRKMIIYIAMVGIVLSNCTLKPVEQPDIVARKTPTLTVDELTFKDLNKNGILDPYEDWRLSINVRVDNLLRLMTLEEKVGLMLHPNIAVQADGVIPDEATSPRRPAPRVYIADRHIRNILNNGGAKPTVFARWSNGMQEIAEETRLGIPIMFSSDPRHGATLGVHVKRTQYFSQWPSREGQYGIAATRDLELVKDFGRVTAEEYRVVGLHMILGPQIDVTTEPRWGRNAGCFSESAELTAKMIEAFIQGCQGETIGSESALCMVKHWPGSGPHKDGRGRQLVYPGDNFDYHLIPWEAAYDAGAIAVMGYYSGTPFDDGLAVNYSRYIMTEILRDKMKFDGVACTDWGVISHTGPLREDLVDMTIKDRYKMSIEAGVDQFGDETDPTPIIELVKERQISEERINQGAGRILRWHFGLGLFENPYVDPEAAATIVRSDENQKLGYEAQLKSIVLLTNDGTLPVAETSKKPPVYIYGIDTAIASEYIKVVDDPKNADLAILRVEATGDRFRPGAEAEEIGISFPKETMLMIKGVADTGVPTVVALNLSGTLAVLPQELLDSTGATLMLFDVLDSALLDVVSGRFNPTGKLPFQIPSTQESVRKQLEDVPFDLENPLFDYGHGLSYEGEGGRKGTGR